MCVHCVKRTEWDQQQSHKNVLISVGLSVFVVFLSGCTLLFLFDCFCDLFLLLFCLPLFELLLDLAACAFAFDFFWVALLTEPR